MALTKMKEEDTIGECSPRTPREGRTRASPREECANTGAIPALWKSIPCFHSCDALLLAAHHQQQAVTVELRSDLLLCFERAGLRRLLFGPRSLLHCAIPFRILDHDGGKQKPLPLSLSFNDSEEGPQEVLELVLDSVDELATFMRAYGRVSLPVELEDFEPLACVGKGKWGKVSVCQRRPGQEGGQSLYAVKEVRIVNWRTATLAQQERLVMTSLKAHPFVIQLHFALKLGSHVYFILDFAPGGDMYTLLRQVRLRASDVLFYAVELALALEHCHGARVVHRDIKPENLLVDQHGHIKLADFGLAKILPRGSPGTRTVCGTEVYAAPEMLRKAAPYGYSVDLWQLGCFVYEFLCGHSPFYRGGDARVAADDDDGGEPAAPPPRRSPRELILAGDYAIPDRVPAVAQHFISAMLAQDPARRLGCPPGALASDRPMAEGWRAVRRHPLFDAVPWGAAARGGLPPPVVNVREGADVLRNFEDQFLMDSAAFAGLGEREARTPCDEAFVGFYFPGF
mmetsp:Transcript_24368/g.42503  ORF Transcript_24368/g.42503 Transcript_24368/m.42503 type:complete len:513 (-) Transcript_24368:228-1766(-)